MKTTKEHTITLPPGTRIETLFVCPGCGSNFFGSVVTPDGWRGHCHGFIPNVGNCSFTWGRSEDHKFFQLTLTVDSFKDWDALYQLQNLEVQTGQSTK